MISLPTFIYFANAYRANLQTMHLTSCCINLIHPRQITPTVDFGMKPSRTSCHRKAYFLKCFLLLKCFQFINQKDPSDYSVPILVVHKVELKCVGFDAVFSQM